MSDGKDLDVESNRSLVRLLLEKTDQSIWNFIPSAYLERFYSLPVETWEELKDKLGPLESSIVVTSNGQLHPINDEPIPSCPVSAEVFQLLTNWFASEGEPVTRYSIDGALERYPILFHVHQLAKKQSYYSRQPQLVMISRSHPFEQLFDIIKVKVLKIASNLFRLWFIELEQELTSVIPLNTFVMDIPRKTLINLNILKDTLLLQGVNNMQYHLAVELKNDKDVYPLDTYQLEVNTSFKGISGLNNLGNTCYMNSALQCLLHIPEIGYYFFYNLYKQELNTTNPLGYHGDVASSFGSLCKSALDSKSAFAPREFKSTIGRYSSMFSGYMQQDSQELLSWLLDALHEDLNRIHKKPYSEKPELEEITEQAISDLAAVCWNQYKSRNDSVIVDLFTGLYQSTLVCPTCSKTSITFDPYNDLTLPLPINKKWYHTFTIVDLSKDNSLGGRIQKLEVELVKTSNFDQLVTYISNFLKIQSKDLFFYEIFRNAFYADFQADHLKNKFLPISDLIKATDDIYVYYIPHESTDIILPVLNSKVDSDDSYNISELFAIPLFIVLSEKDVSSFGQIRSKLENLIQILTKSNIKNDYEEARVSQPNYIEKDFYNRQDFPKLLESDSIEKKERELDKEDDGYDSDISMANPYTSADLGFVIEYYNVNPKLPPRHRIGQNFKQRVETERVIHVPHTPPNLKDFRPLSTKLPALKQNYYHYPNYSNSPTTPEIEVPVSDVSEEFVLVEKTDGDAIKSDMIDSTSSSSDEEPAMGTLFDEKLSSECSLPPPIPEKESGQNSPVNSNVSTPPNSVISNHPTLVHKDTILNCNWQDDIYQRYFQTENQTWANPPMITNAEIKKSKARFERQRNTKVSLYDCLKMFSTPEVLGEQDLWYCPQCKEHKQATKTIQLWSSGDILTIHLKRFHSARAFSDKIDMLVEFPIEGLDISQYIANPNSTENIYDLIAVDNHYGGLGGGHYTAAAKNFEDGAWYYFNDSRVTSIKPEETITSSAYLLFYRRRKPEEALGGEKLAELISNGRQSYQSLVNARKEVLSNLSDQLKTWWKCEEEIESKVTLKRVNDGAEFEHNEEINLYSDDESEETDVDMDMTNSRKQRLIARDSSNNKLVQIKSDGRQELTLSPRLLNIDDADNISECNEI